MKLEFCCLYGSWEEERSRVCVVNDRKTNFISGILRMTGLKSLEGVLIHQLVFKQWNVLPNGAVNFPSLSVFG